MTTPRGSARGSARGLARAISWLLVAATLASCAAPTHAAGASPSPPASASS